MSGERVAGIIELQVDGELFLAKGEFTYNLGVPKKEMVVGSDAVHGYTEKPQVAFIEGAITDTKNLDMEALRRTSEATVTLKLGNGKIVVVEGAVEASDGNVTTAEAEAEVRFEGVRGREIAP